MKTWAELKAEKYANAPERLTKIEREAMEEAERLERERFERVLRDLQRVKPGDSLTHFDDGATLGDVFMLARTQHISLIGYEFTVAADDGYERRMLVGHFGEYGGGRDATMTPWDEKLAVRAARKVWFP